MNTFYLRVLASNETFYEGECLSLTVPTPDGEREFLAHHSNMIAAVVPGELRAKLPDGKTGIAAVSEGILKAEHNEVLVLADTVERPEEIDANRAREKEAEAKEAVLQKRSIQEYKMAQAALAREISRLKVKSRYGI